jgi:hypothetical protein
VPSRRLLLYLAADLSLAAAVAHALVAPEHFDEAFVYGAAFVGMAAAQIAFVPLVLRWPSARLFWTGIAGNAIIILAYLDTRLVGIPFGPSAGEVEAVGLIDIPSKLAEVALIGVLAWLLARPPEEASLRAADGTQVVLGEA